MTSLVRTTCCYCGVGCGVEVRRDRRGALHLRGDADHPANHGQLCSKGRALLHTVRATGNRLLRPELRVSREQDRQPASWDAAIAHAAQGMRRIQAQHGRDSVGLYISGQCLTEEYYLANKLAKGFLGTNNIDTNSRLCMSSAVAGYKATLGSDSVPGCYEDLDQTDTFLIAGSNMAWAHPILFRRVEARKKADPQRVRIITIDPRRTATAEVSDLHLPIRPGTDVALFHALANVLWAEGDCDTGFIEEHCSGWEELRALIGRWSPERAAQVCGIPADDIRKAARALGGGRRFVSLWTMGLNQSVVGTDKNVALINLSLITGQIGKPGCGPFSLTGQPNAMGGREVGGLANLLPAHRALNDPAHRAAVEQFWKIPAGTIAPKPGLTAVEMIDAIHAGKLKALWVIATNPVASLPAGLGVDAALRKLDLLIVQDCAHNDTTPFADVILPAATWLEKTGSMTNSERRIHLVEKLVDPPGEARPDWRILCDVAQAMGFGEAFAHPDPAAVYAEHAALTAGTDCDVSGLSHARIRAARAIQWPVPAGDHPGTPRLFTDHRFATPDGKARLGAPDFVERSEALDADFPLVLTTGRLRDQWHTMTKTGEVRRLLSQEPVPFCEIHPTDAAARTITDGTIIAVRSRRGMLRVAARITPTVRPGTVFLPMHWGPRKGGDTGRTNAITSDLIDPVSKEPDLKYAAVQISRWTPLPRRIVVVGAGAAALAFVRAHLKNCPQDTILVLGDEPHGFYNRVALPHYIAGAATWDSLATDSELPAAEAPDLRKSHEHATRTRGCLIRQHGFRVAAIDRSQRMVITEDGAQHRYDELVLATGSRSALPWRGPLPAHGAHTLRRRTDADAMIALAGPGRRAVIVGAGLLGLELADALHQRGAHVTVLQRSARVMGKQLDDTASDHLVDILCERGIDVRLDTGLAAVLGTERVTGVRLPDGSELPADLVVFAAGTEANSELAHTARLAVGKGITIDPHLRTSDPHIYAIGECAECDGIRVGTTAGAVAQANALAEWLRGNTHAPWRPVATANILKVHDVQLASAGRVEAESGDDTIVLHDPARRFYQKCIIRHDRLVGVLMLGDTSGFAALNDLVSSGTELDDMRDSLLRPGGAPEPVAGNLVCSCFRVGDTTIRNAIAAGARDADAVGRACRAGTGCGSCRPEIIKLVGATSQTTAAHS
jgi:ferredoxin-nitrate reductase